jgi:hypothetical protein
MCFWRAMKAIITSSFEYFCTFLHLLHRFHFYFLSLQRSNKMDFLDISVIDGIFFIHLSLIWFAIHFFIRLYFKKIEKLGFFKLFENVIIILIIFTSSTKILQYIRYKESYSFLYKYLLKYLYSWCHFSLSSLYSHWYLLSFW